MPVQRLPINSIAFARRGHKAVSSLFLTSYVFYCNDLYSKSKFNSNLFTLSNLFTILFLIIKSKCTLE